MTDRRVDGTASSGAGRAWQVLRKDLRLGPRSPLLLWALVVPIVITVLVRGVFGGLFDAEPRLGIVDDAGSALAADLADREGLAVELVEDAGALHAAVADGGFDAGLVLPGGFDDAVRAGERPDLALWLSGLAAEAEHAVLVATVLDAVRALTGASPPTTVDVVQVGAAGLPVDLRLLPLIILYAVAVPGGMVPAAGLVEEKEQGTLQALLASPASMGEVLAAKGAFGVLLGVVAGTVTLALNDAFGGSPGAVLAAVAVGAAMMALVGLILGCWARDTNTLFAAWKGGGLFLFLPAVFFVWPGLPAWPAYFLPTYYFLQPAYAVGVEGASFGDVAGYLAVAVALCLALVPAVVAVGRWLEVHLAAGRGGAAPAPELVGADTPS